VAATILLADHTGRLGNKLILFAHVIAAAAEYGCRVINLSILPAAHYFEGLHLNPLGSYPRRLLPLDLRWLFRSFRKPTQDWVRGQRGKPAIQNRWLTVVDRMTNKPIYRLDTPEFAKLTQTTRLIILWGFPYRCPPLVEKHAEKIRAFFKIRPQAAPRLFHEYAEAAAAGRDTLAVHIRQDDFRDFCGGKYYFSPTQTAASLAAGGWNIQDPSTRVWACSDEPLPPDTFPLESTAGLPRPLGEDLFIMSRCRQLMAGWSTLAYFCAFLANNQYYRIPSAGHAPELRPTGSLGDT